MAAPVEALDEDAGGGDHPPEGVSEATEAKKSGEAGDSDAPRPGDRWLLRSAAFAAVVPFVVSAVRALIRGWYPTTDNGFFALRAGDVFTKHHPLLGTWSSASIYSKQDMNHPGPLHFDLLALPVKLLGPAAGVVLGIAAINVAAVLLIAWLVQRRGGPRAAALAMFGCALLAWSLGSEMLYDPWNLHSALFPFALFLVAVWCAVDGDLVALPVMVVAGSDILQLHLSYVLLVPSLSALAFGAVLVRVVRRQAPWRRSVAWAGAALLIGLLCWAQPLYEQAQPNQQGNITRLIDGNRDDAYTAPTDIVVEMMGVVSLPPAWLPPEYGSPPFLTREDPTWLVVASLVVLAGLLGAVGWRAWRRRSPLITAGALVSVTAIGIGYVTLAKMPVRMGITATYTRFLWPLGMVVWLVVVLGVVDEVRQRQLGQRFRLRLSPRVQRFAAAVPVLPVVVPVLTAGAALMAAVPTVDHSGSNPEWSTTAIEAMDDDLVAALEDKGPVLVEMYPYPDAMALGPAVMVVLQDHGIPFYVRSPGLARQVGESRLYEAGDADWKIVIKATRGARAGGGEREIAAWSALSRSDAAELESLQAELHDLISEHGLPIADDMLTLLQSIGGGELIARFENRAGDADELLEGAEFTELSGYLDQDIFPTSLTDHWRELQAARDNRIIRVYASRL